MVKRLILVLLSLFLFCQPKVKETFVPVDFTHVKLADGFWKSRVETVINTTIPFAFDKCVETGRVSNFKRAAGLEEGKFQGHFGFDDSDVYKIMEGASYALMLEDNPELDAWMDSLITWIGGAQQDDGYLYTAYTLKVNDYAQIWCTYSDKGRFYGCQDSHEMYDAGHMYEAAVAHYQATGKKSFLNIATKNADFIYKLCVEEGKPFYPGHQEIEIGLAKLYRVTGDKKYLELARYLLDQRGRGLRKFGHTSVYDQASYTQDHLPVTEQHEATGHAVRAGYMYTAMTEIANLMDDPAYQAAVDSLWQNVVNKKLYITGGVGARYEGEAFGDNYELPNRAYAETCAAIANVYWNYRMFLLHGDAKYMDVLERSLYNGVLPGISLDGKLFFYPNVLQHDGVDAFNQGTPGRSPWFDCSCCPSNLSRFIPSVAGYAFAQQGQDIYVNLFMNSTTQFQTDKGDITLNLVSNYPWDGNIKMTIDAEQVPAGIRIRIPEWTRNQPLPGDLYTYARMLPAKPEVKLNGQVLPNSKLEKGYLVIRKQWQKGDTIELELPMQVRQVIANHSVVADRGLTAFEYGPLVYCAEGVDNGGHALDITVPDEMDWQVSYNPDLLNGVNVLESANDHITLVPYYAWNNRGNGEMTVWFRQ